MADNSVNESDTENESGPGSRSWQGRLPETGGSVRVELTDGGKVSAIVPIADDPALPWLSAGWIDLQVNGCGGHDLNGEEVSEQAVEEVTRHLWSKGVTRYLPTVITASFASMRQSMSMIAAVRRAGGAEADSIGGIHMEGPYFSAENGPRGAHPPEHVRSPDLAEFARLQEATEGAIAVVTLAPETKGALGLIRYLAERGIIASIGHSGAAPEQIAAAAEAGATMSTHLGNGAHPILPRHPNYIWEQLADDRLHAGLIADGHHLPISTLKAMLRAKGERAFVVSDCVSLAGMPAGVYGDEIGGKVILQEDGRLALHSDPRILAGSAQTLEKHVQTLIGKLGYSVAEAVRLITERPADAMGWRDCGRLTVGSAGNLTLFEVDEATAEIRIVETVVNGKSVYKN